MSILFSPLELGELKLANRVMVSPMCQYVAEEGKATAWHMIHLGGLANSGAGLLCIEATAVEPGGRITPGDLGLWDDETEMSLKPVVDAVRRHSNVRLAIQLGHAGRKASSEVPWKGGQQIAVADGGWIADAPSALPQKEGEELPRELDRAGMIRIRDAFVSAARRADRLGIDAIELHCAHGYLLHEFLSPISNTRTDEYGGTVANRMRYPLEVVDAVRAVWPKHKPLGVKVSATDWMDAGWDIEQTIEFAKALKTRGVDWIDVSSGGISPLQKITLGPGYQVPFANQIKKATGVTTICVGLITDAQQAEDILSSGQADAVAIARGMLYDPRWTWHAAATLGATVEAPRQYWRAPPQRHAAIFDGVMNGAR